MAAVALGRLFQGSAHSLMPRQLQKFSCGQGVDLGLRLP